MPGTTGLGIARGHQFSCPQSTPREGLLSLFHSVAGLGAVKDFPKSQLSELLNLMPVP